MTAWGDDPELLATFRAEVEERLASLQEGLLALETHGAPRQLIAGLFRDAHTVKGSARMLGLHGVLRVSHSMEDLLGALRDGRFDARTDLVDLLLTSCDAIGRALPGGELDDAALEPVVTALAAAVDGQSPVVVPVLRASGAGPALVEPPAPAPVAAAPAGSGPLVVPDPPSPAPVAKSPAAMSPAAMRPAAESPAVTTPAVEAPAPVPALAASPSRPLARARRRPGPGSAARSRRGRCRSGCSLRADALRQRLRARRGQQGLRAARRGR